jgi:manganese transport protein
MGVFANKLWVKTLAWICAVIIIGLNARLVADTISGWISESSNPLMIWVTVVPIAIGCGLLLLYVALPASWIRRKQRVAPVVSPIEFTEQKYSRIGVALDYGTMDAKVLSHAISAAKKNEAELFLFHIVEGVSGQLYGGEAFDAEARQDKDRLDAIAEELRRKGIEVFPKLGFGNVPNEIIKLTREHNIDLLIMGAHGHRGMRDLLFGASISEVRHALKIPVLVIQ